LPSDSACCVEAAERSLALQHPDELGEPLVEVVLDLAGQLGIAESVEELELEHERAKQLGQRAVVRGERRLDVRHRLSEEREKRLAEELDDIDDALLDLGRDLVAKLANDRVQRAQNAVDGGVVGRAQLFDELGQETWATAEESRAQK
jgi:hypothetical protein